MTTSVKITDNWSKSTRFIQFTNHTCCCVLSSFTGFSLQIRSSSSQPHSALCNH